LGSSWHSPDLLAGCKGEGRKGDKRRERVMQSEGRGRAMEMREGQGEAGERERREGRAGACLGS